MFVRQNNIFQDVTVIGIFTVFWSFIEINSDELGYLDKIK